MPLLKQGCIAAGHPATAEAGAMIMRAGGNAVDAAIAAVCTAFTAEPALTAIGGGGFLLLRDASGKALLYDGFARMPKQRIENVTDADFRPIPVDFGDHVQTFHIGRASVATPSLPAMLFAAHKAHGKMPLRELLQPAIEAARNGIALNTLQASFLHLLEPILGYSEACRALHMPNGDLPNENDTFRNPDLANTLELLALEGIEEMYRGDMARAIVAACRPGGMLAMPDLEAPQYEVRRPLTVKALGGTLLTNPPPSSGGCLIAFSLHLLDALLKETPQTPLNLLIAESLRAASLARGEDFDRQVHQSGMEKQFLESRRWRQAVDMATQRLQGEAGKYRTEPENRHGSTTHISVMDKDGLAVSLTSSNGEGSGIVVPGTGIHLNNMLGEADINPLGFHRLPGGEKLSSMMAPSIFVRHGRPAMVLGSGGSNRLRGAILQVLCRHLVEKMPLEAAISAPRLHNEGDILDAEPGCLPESEAVQLQAMDWNIRHWSERSIYFGGVHALALEGSEIHGAGDPRRGGSVAWA
jgi:gamma-glutamyltranspeptidase/glutathione hydrolase